MQLDINLCKDDKSAPWGFRLIGGVEYDAIFTIIKVFENSLAEKCGLRENDIIIAINQTATNGLTHQQAQDLLLTDPNQIILTIEREDVVEELKDIEIETVNEFNGIKAIPEVSNNNTQGQGQEKKWSTFLQRPSNPQPVKNNANPVEMVELYKVKIVKQKKKPLIPDVEEIKVQVEPDDLVCNNNITENGNKETEEVLEAELDVNENGEEEAVNGSEILQQEPIENQDEEIEINEEDQDEKEEELDQSIEEKLAEVQRQLEALAHLPSTIQLTINAVTEQLASLLHIKKKIEPDEISDQNSIPENDFAEAVVTDEENANGEMLNEEEDGNNLENGAHEEDVEELIEETTEEYVMTEEEKEFKRLEEELFQKQQKKLQEEFKNRRDDKRLKPIDRPIILPGGRRWSQPDDACLAVRHPKMTDEKIADTIESYSEVLIGKAKGINFLKYQPPPKNLDYLQKSNVYRLVHDMEPPVRGICSRAGKILAEQDYQLENESQLEEPSLQ